MKMSIVLMDGSGGGSISEALDIAAGHSLVVERIPGPVSGSGQAYLEGFRIALEREAHLVATLDANGRHDASEIPRLVDRLIEKDLDVIIGSRWTRGSGTPGLTPLRWLLGRAANYVFRLLTGTFGIADATTSFRVARAEVVRGFEFGDIPVNSHSVQTTFVADAVAKGYRVAEAPIIYRPPVVAGGEMTARDVAQFCGHLLHLRRGVDRVRQRRLSRSGRRFSENFFGASEDLERLGTAKNFFDWVLEEFHPYLQGRVLEVGAGLGTITRKLVDSYPDLSIVGLEPADNMFSELQAFAALNSRVDAYRETLAEYRKESDLDFDAALYLNVLEHIEDDEREVRLARESLKPGGALLVFGPAHEWLYSDLDYRAGHYRRYSVEGITRLVSKAGFEVVTAKYLDVLGVFPYYTVYRWLRHREIAGSTLWGYDRLIVPLSRALQKLLRKPPVGKNIVLIARKAR